MGAYSSLARSNKVKPKTAKDKTLARKHLKDEIRFDKRHASDHRKAMAKPGYSKKYNLAHERGHLRDMKEARRKYSGSYAK